MAVLVGCTSYIIGLFIKKKRRNEMIWTAIIIYGIVAFPLGYWFGKRDSQLKAFWAKKITAKRKGK